MNGGDRESKAQLIYNGLKTLQAGIDKLNGMNKKISGDDQLDTASVMEGKQETRATLQNVLESAPSELTKMNEELEGIIHSIKEKIF